MALVALDGTPLVAIGSPFVRGNGSSLPSAAVTTQDAVNEAAIMYGHIVTDDGGTHTVDTTGSSSLQWKAGTITFASASTTFKVGLAVMDTSAGPPGRAVNVSDVITFSVSRSMIGGGGGITTNLWHSHTPDSGTMTISNGDFIAFCTQMTARGGTDSVATQCGSIPNALPRPAVTRFLSGAYGSINQVPNALIVFSDGHRGWFYGGAVFATANTSRTWNSGSSPNEYGNVFQMPFPVKIHGIEAAANVQGDTDFVLYSNPLGTPVAEKTVSVDLNTIGASIDLYSQYFFASPYSVTANQPIAAIMKPTTATSVASAFKTYNSAADQITEMCGTNGYAVSRSSGAFAAQNSNLDRYSIGILVGAFDAGGAAGRAVQINNDSLVA